MKNDLVNGAKKRPGSSGGVGVHVMRTNRRLLALLLRLLLADVLGGVTGTLLLLLRFSSDMTSTRDGLRCGFDF